MAHRQSNFFSYLCTRIGAKIRFHYVFWAPELVQRYVFITFFGHPNWCKDTF